MSEINEEVVETVDESMVEEIPPETVGEGTEEFSGGAQNDFDTSNAETATAVGGDEENTAKVLAIISLVAGILSLIACCAGAIGGIFAIAAIVCGIISIKKSQTYKTMSIIGIVCGGVGVVIAFLGGIITGILAVIFGSFN